MGLRGAMEEGIIARESTLPFRAIRAAAVRGRNPIALLRNLVIIAAGVRDALALLRTERPDAILGTGGYVCVPLFVAARRLGIPTLIYLPDIIPGYAVKTLSRIANAVACSFAPSLRYLPASKTVVTGYPIRPELWALDRTAAREEMSLDSDLPVVLIYGGSLGARAINQAIAALLEPLTTLAQVMHICGREGDENWLQEAATALPAANRARYHLYPYLTGTMSTALAAADLAICRAGASTLAELPAVGLPAVLVPLKVVAQDANAAYLSDQGAAVTVDNDTMLGDGDPEAGPLWQAVHPLLVDAVRRETMRERSRALAVPDAAARLADAVLRLV
ncbi:MAG: UDP-N-acetylglucosamine--N-acetylmuramyl-(pentapeptide) pyrophosphoryl-undecaprenol N-acetylglucosamine transferase [Herpetosiphon sp.]